MFNILVFMGVGVTVWYRFIPGEINQPPEDLLPPRIHPFKNPIAVVEGYKKVSYLMTKDIVQTVISTFMHQSPFNEILSVELANLNYDTNYRDRFTSVGIAILIASFLATKVMIPVTP